MWRSLLHAPIFFGGLTVLVGLGSGLAEIREQSYWALGFERNLKLVVWDHATNWLVVGLLCGLVYGVLALAVAAADRAMGRPDGTGRLGLLYVIVLAAGMVMLAGSPDYSSPPRRMGFALTVMVWCVCVFASKAVRRDSRLWLVGRGLRLATLAIPSLIAALLLAWGIRGALGLSVLVRLLRQPEVMTACAVALLLAIWMLARRSTGREEAFDPLREARLSPIALPWILLIAAGFVTIGSTPALPVGNPHNVLIISVDTLRADHTSLTGAREATERTPRLGAWARDGTVFGTAISQAPWTMPSFASVMTGKYPRQHGAISLAGFLRKGEVTLAEILRESGYWTGGVISHSYVDTAHGFGQGFDLYDEDNVLGHWPITSEAVSDRAIELLNEHAGDPFFMFLHYFDPHYEYRDHGDERTADDYDGWLRDNPVIEDISGLRGIRHLLGTDEVGFLKDLYDEEIAFTDAQIGRVLDHLSALGMENDTAIVFVSDHGEEFLERGWLGHTIHLHDELVRVPLAITLPGVEDPVPTIHDPVETRAISATLLEYLEIEPESFDFSPSLLPAIRGEGDAPEEAFSEVWLPDAPVSSGKRFQMSMLRTKHWKLVRDHGRGFVRLFDLRADPGETTDVSEAEAERLADLDARMSDWLSVMGDQSAAPTAEMTPEMKAKLRALGYLGDK